MAAECGLAEAYVLRKLHKEKMKAEREEKARLEGIDLGGSKPTTRKGRTFFGMFRKVHVHPSSSGGVEQAVDGYDKKPVDSVAF